MFESAAAKWLRGTEHLKALYDGAREFAKTDPVPIVAYCEIDTGKKVWRVDGQPRTPPIRLALILGDCLYNFRSSLDHLAEECVSQTGGTLTTDVSFPLFIRPNSWASRHLQKLPGTSPLMDRIRAAIKQYQPAEITHTYRKATLAAFETLYTIDKHRHLNLITACVEMGFWSHALPIRADTFIHDGVVKDGTILASVPREHMDVDFGPGFGIALDEPGVDPESAIHLLFGIREITAEIIATFAREFFGTTIRLSTPYRL